MYSKYSIIRKRVNGGDFGKVVRGVEWGLWEEHHHHWRAHECWPLHGQSTLYPTLQSWKLSSRQINKRGYDHVSDDISFGKKTERENKRPPDWALTRSTCRMSGRRGVGSKVEQNEDSENQERKKKMLEWMLIFYRCGEIKRLKDGKSWQMDSERNLWVGFSCVPRFAKRVSLGDTKLMGSIVHSSLSVKCFHVDKHSNI